MVHTAIIVPTLADSAIVPGIDASPGSKSVLIKHKNVRM
jgi:hypothetical protein